MWSLLFALVGIIAFIGAWVWGSVGMTTRRKLAIASWSHPSEGNIAAKITVDCTKILQYIAKKREQTGAHITITHVVGRVIGICLKKAPSLNGRICFGRFVPFKSIDISYLVVLPGGTNLAKAKISNVDKKSVVDIANELSALATKVRQGRDENFKKSMGPVSLLPTWILRPLVGTLGLLSNAIGIEIAALGLEKFSFGACVITSVGMMGVDEATAPFTPFMHVPILLVIPSIRKIPMVVEGDRIEARDALKLVATMDHRYLDGYQGAVLGRTLRECFENPELLDDAAYLTSQPTFSNPEDKKTEKKLQ